MAVFGCGGVGLSIVQGARIGGARQIIGVDVFDGKLEMARMLLEAGADPNLQVYAGGSSVFRAYMSGNAEMIALLERYGGVVDGITVGILGLEDKARQLLDADDAGTVDPKAFGHPIPPDGRIVHELLWGAAGAGNGSVCREAIRSAGTMRSSRASVT